MTICPSPNARRSAPRLNWEALHFLPSACGKCKCFILGRVNLDRPFETWLIEATAADIVQVLPLDLLVVLALNQLPEAFHSDPADRIIVATARVYDLPLMTRDRAIRSSDAVRLWSA